MVSPRIPAFLAGKPGRVPFMPILMRFCARHTRTPYRSFILDPEEHCRSNLVCAEAFGSDWVNVMSDPYCEFEAYGGHVEYPEDSLPLDRTVLLPEFADVERIGPVDFTAFGRGRGRLRELEIFRRDAGGRTLICGWIEGPVAEYCDLRSLTNACLDFMDEPDRVDEALAVIRGNAMKFAELQVAAGATCIGIGDAACSQIGPRLYERFGFVHEKILVDHIHRLGVLAKLHICGDTTPILPRMIATGADIVDVDHLVRDMRPFAPLLGPGQALCGNVDPVATVRNGTPGGIAEAAAGALAQAPGKLILSAGCEITPDTSEANLLALSRAAGQWCGRVV